ncbi:hypothetical protein BpHYR1_047019 [Brachionus plicatilis]|uniref:Uncharacterized protein n=1 Tax=Brachionus plicatilis TaxID=10195 RepID=A0A3M7RQU1_BRAPC|nr:hypothetical protein BpHYR1_047019 [Brachionus plicatilis]
MFKLSWKVVDLQTECKKLKDFKPEILIADEAKAITTGLLQNANNLNNGKIFLNLNKYFPLTKWLDVLLGVALGNILQEKINKPFFTENPIIRFIYLLKKN